MLVGYYDLQKSSKQKLFAKFILDMLSLEMK